MKDGKGVGFGTIFFFLLLGGLIGVGLALMFAPLPGEETRRKIKEAAEDVKEKVSEVTKLTEETMEQVKEAASDYVEQTKRKATSTVEKGKEAYKKVKPA